MTDLSLADRMKDYFGRQIRLLEDMLGDFDLLNEDLASGDVQRSLERKDVTGKALQLLDEEFRALWPEWEKGKAALPESLRQSVRAMAHRAEELAQRLSDQSAEATKLVDVQLSEVKTAIEELRRGRDRFRKYSPGVDADPNFMDRKA